MFEGCVKLEILIQPENPIMCQRELKSFQQPDVLKISIFQSFSRREF